MDGKEGGRRIKKGRGSFITAFPEVVGAKCVTKKGKLFFSFLSFFLLVSVKRKVCDLESSLKSPKTSVKLYYYLLLRYTYLCACSR